MKTLIPAVVTAAAFLAGCADTPYYGYNGYNGYGGTSRSGVSNTVKGAGVGAVLGGGAGYYMDQQQRQQVQSPWTPPPNY